MSAHDVAIHEGAARQIHGVVVHFLAAPSEPSWLRLARGPTAPASWQRR